MATQHPDNATAAYFLEKPFINAKDEIEECYRCFKDLKAQEYMWDWEGKFVDESVIDRLFNQHHEFFKKNQIGKDVFITFRIPNIWIESSHKLPRAFMNMLSAEKAAKTYKFHSPPLFEIILPMTTKASQLSYLQKTFCKIAKATEEIFDFKSDLKNIEIIPLVEEFYAIKDCNRILHGYVNYLKKEHNYTPKYIRAFTARSDTALNAGLLPAKLAIKIAISNYHNFTKETGIKVYPWVGGGCLPFRGGINPENIEAALDEYKGVSTLTVQSAFRYDYDLKEVKKAIAALNKNLPLNYTKYDRITPKEQTTLVQFTNQATKFYKPIIEEIAPIINTIATKMPSHRERVQHVGLFGYSRGLGKVTLPRAIKFTGSLYSLGVPPELIGSGKALKFAKDKGMLPLITKLCPFLQEDFKHAGHYLNRENLDLLSKKYPAFKEINEDIQLMQEILQIEIGPQQPHHYIHRNFTSNIFHKLKLKEDFSEDVLKAAQIRKSLG